MLIIITLFVAIISIFGEKSFCKICVFLLAMKRSIFGKPAKNKSFQDRILVKRYLFGTSFKELVTPVYVKVWLVLSVITGSLWLAASTFDIQMLSSGHVMVCNYIQHQI